MMGLEPTTFCMASESRDKPRERCNPHDYAGNGAVYGLSGAG
jgi:hypothetical protein